MHEALQHLIEPISQISFQEYTSTDKTDIEFALEVEYYNSKRLQVSHPKAALNGFRKILNLETEPGKWGFKALKQMIKIHSMFVSS